MAYNNKPKPGFLETDRIFYEGGENKMKRRIFFKFNTCMTNNSFQVQNVFLNYRRTVTSTETASAREYTCIKKVPHTWSVGSLAEDILDQGAQIETQKRKEGVNKCAKTEIS